MNTAKGVTINGVPDMKFILDGRVESSAGSRGWNLNQHGFAFIQSKQTSIPLKTFHSPSSPGDSFFKFSGSLPVPVGPSTSSSSWTSTYNKEIAEVCKSVAPSAEAVVVSYRVLRKADLSFSDGKYSVAPKEPNCEAHQVASKMVSLLNTVDFYPVADQDRLFGLLETDGANDYLREMVDKAVLRLNPGATAELKTRVIDLLHNDKAYDFPALSREAFGNFVQKRKELIVPPKEPESQAHQVVSKILGSYQYLDFVPKPTKRKIGSQLHLEGPEGVEAYLAEVLKAHSAPKDQNPHAFMPGASPEEQAEVMLLLRDDTEYYDFVARSRRLIPKPAEDEDNIAADLDNVAFQPPAVGGLHTDVSAEGFLNQFRAAIPESHELGMPSSGKKRRVLFLKFWRNIAESPILNHHLAMVDKSSIDDTDIVESEINFKGFSIKQNRFEEQIDFDKLRLVYFPSMQRDEIICFQQGDLTMHGLQGGAGQSKTTFPEGRQNHATFHGAFEDPTASQDAPPRQSVECAAFVFLPEEPEFIANL